MSKTMSKAAQELADQEDYLRANGWELLTVAGKSDAEWRCPMTQMIYPLNHALDSQRARDNHVLKQRKLRQ